MATRAPLKPGQQLGPYRVDALIGAGGMGEVYRAHDSRLGRDIALKILPPEFAQDPERLRRFEQEARAAAALNHPGIIVIHSVEEAGGVHFLTMELVEGKPLSAVIPRQGFPVARLLEVGAALADALGSAHARGIIHRDLKPANVMVTPEGRVKILDFGLAKLRPTANPSDLTTQAALDATADGRLMGTVAYMSPEQAEGREVDQRSDLFSLGVVLFELATGERPFKGESTMAVLSSLLKDTPSVSDGRPDFPRDLVRIIRRCLSKTPAHRYQSAIDLRNDLDELRHDLDAGTAIPLRSPSDRRSNLWRMFAWIGGTAAAAFLTFIYLAWNGVLNLGFSQQPSARLVATPAKITVTLPDSVKAIVGLAVSADGSRVAFAGGGQLWVYEVTTQELHTVAGVVGSTPQFPFWSPDGEFIAYFLGEPAQLMKIPSAGGIAEKICDVTVARGGSWGADNTILFSQPDGIFRIAAHGGRAVQVTAVDKDKGEVRHSWPHFAADGRHFTYFEYGTNVVYLGSVDPKEPPVKLAVVASQAFLVEGFLLTAGNNNTLRAQVLSTAGEAIGDPISLEDSIVQWGAVGGSQFFAASPAVLAYSTRAVPLHQFSLVDRVNTQPTPLGPALRLATNMIAGERPWALSPTSVTVAFTQPDPDGERSHVWLLDLQRGTPEPLTAGRTSESYPVWHSNGDQIAFSKVVSGDRSIYSRRRGGDAEAPVLPTVSTTRVPHDWRDGTLLFDWQTGEVAPTIWWVRTDGSAPPQKWLTTDSRQAGARFSPDGRWVVYEESAGTSEIYVRPFPGPEPRTKVSPAGGNTPRWRSDGKAVFYVKDRTLMEVDLDIGTAVKAGAARPVLKIGDSLGYAALPGGKSFVLCLPVGPVPKPTITIVLNWTGLVTKK